MRTNVPVLPSWLFIVVGIAGFVLARGGGFDVDLLCTVSDAMRTLAMLGVIVFGCVMVFRDLSQRKHVEPQRIIPVNNTVTLSAQQFKTLVGLATSNMAQLAAAEVPIPAVPAVPDEIPVPVPEKIQEDDNKIVPDDAAAVPSA